MVRKEEEINISFYFRVVVKVVHHFIKQERFADEQKEGTIYSFIFMAYFARLFYDLLCRMFFSILIAVSTSLLPPGSSRGSH